MKLKSNFYVSGKLFVKNVVYTHQSECILNQIILLQIILSPFQFKIQDLNPVSNKCTISYMFFKKVLINVYFCMLCMLLIIFHFHPFELRRQSAIECWRSSSEQPAQRTICIHHLKRNIIIHLVLNRSAMKICFQRALSSPPPSARKKNTTKPNK